MFDVIITCEGRCWDAVCEELGTRGGIYNVPVHVINFEIKDAIDEALKGGQAIAKLVQQVSWVLFRGVIYCLAHQESSSMA